jgi:hypothetical protein
MDKDLVAVAVESGAIGLVPTRPFPPREEG